MHHTLNYHRILTPSDREAKTRGLAGFRRIEHITGTEEEMLGMYNILADTHDILLIELLNDRGEVINRKDRTNYPELGLENWPPDPEP